MRSGCWPAVGRIGRGSPAQAEKGEKSLRRTFACLGAEVTVYGRMDLFEDGDVPYVEEIKLSARARPEPLPEHWAQALCYGAMLAPEKPCGRVRLCVCYVDETGEALSPAMRKRWNGHELDAALRSLLEPWTAFALRESAYRRERDESLRTLAFPYEAYRKGQRELAVQVYTAIGAKSGCLPACPPAQARARRCCILR